MTAKERKNIPVASGVYKYFPKALRYIAIVSKAGNDQHNPGQPLFWDRSKSGDEIDAGERHMLDHLEGKLYDTDNILHLGKHAWRGLAALEKLLESLENE